LVVAESAELATRPKEVAGARPESQGAELGALAKAQLSGALRLVSAEAVDDVERFADHQLIAAGKITIMSLEAVQKALAERWQSRRDEVFAFADGVLARALGARGIHLRVSDSDYFIIHPSLSRLQGQAACLRYLREIQTRFVGSADHAVVGILQVTKIGKGRLETQPVDANKVEQIANDPGEDLSVDQGTHLAAFHEDTDISTKLVNRWTPFTASDGRTLRISATLEPVYELKGFTRIGFRMIRRVIVVDTAEELTPQQVSALSTGDLLRADLATITRGIDRLKVEGAGEQQLSLIVPVSFSSLANARGRAELVEPVREAAALVKLGVICEVVDIEGVPTSALLAVTALLRPLSLLVVGRLTRPTASAFARLAGAGFQALSFECPHAGVGEAEFLGWASASLAAARKIARSVLVYRAGSMKRAGALASLGATHISIDVE
jgi:hypothetical protein